MLVFRRSIQRLSFALAFFAARPDLLAAQRLSLGLSVGALVPARHYRLGNNFGADEGTKTGFAVQGRVAVRLHSAFAVEALGMRSTADNQAYLPVVQVPDGHSQGSALRLALRLAYEPFHKSSTTPTFSVGPIWARTHFEDFGAPGVWYTISAFGLGIGAGLRQIVNPDVELRVAVDDYIFRYPASQSFFQGGGLTRPTQHDFVGTVGLAVRLKH